MTRGKEVRKGREGKGKQDAVRGCIYYLFLTPARKYEKREGRKEGKGRKTKRGCINIEGEGRKIQVCAEYKNRCVDVGSGLTQVREGKEGWVGGREN